MKKLTLQEIIDTIEKIVQNIKSRTEADYNFLDNDGWYSQKCYDRGQIDAYENVIEHLKAI